MCAWGGGTVWRVMHLFPYSYSWHLTKLCNVFNSVATSYDYTIFYDHIMFHGNDVNHEESSEMYTFNVILKHIAVRWSWADDHNFKMWVHKVYASKMVRSSVPLPSPYPCTRFKCTYSSTGQCVHGDVTHLCKYCADTLFLRHESGNVLVEERKPVRKEKSKHNARTVAGEKGGLKLLP